MDPSTNAGYSEPASAVTQLMQRCRQCESSMLNTETECMNCGAPVRDTSAKSDAKSRFRTGIKYFMYVCGGMAVASLFVDVGASFMTLVAITILLGLVLSSAEEMLIDREKE